MPSQKDDCMQQQHQQELHQLVNNNSCQQRRRQHQQQDDDHMQQQQQQQLAPPKKRRSLLSLYAQDEAPKAADAWLQQPQQQRGYVQHLDLTDMADVLAHFDGYVAPDGHLFFTSCSDSASGSWLSSSAGIGLPFYISHAAGVHGIHGWQGHIDSSRGSSTVAATSGGSEEAACQQQQQQSADAMAYTAAVFAALDAAASLDEPPASAPDILQNQHPPETPETPATPVCNAGPSAESQSVAAQPPTAKGCSWSTATDATLPSQAVADQLSQHWQTMQASASKLLLAAAAAAAATVAAAAVVGVAPLPAAAAAAALSAAAGATAAQLFLAAGNGQQPDASSTATPAVSSSSPAATKAAADVSGSTVAVATAAAVPAVGSSAPAGTKPAADAAGFTAAAAPPPPPLNSNASPASSSSNTIPGAAAAAAAPAPPTSTTSPSPSITGVSEIILHRSGYHFTLSIINHQHHTLLHFDSLGATLSHAGFAAVGSLSRKTWNGMMDAATAAATAASAGCGVANASYSAATAAAAARSGGPPWDGFLAVPLPGAAVQRAGLNTCGPHVMFVALLYVADTCRFRSSCSAASAALDAASTAAAAVTQTLRRDGESMGCCDGAGEIDHRCPADAEANYQQQQQQQQHNMAARAAAVQSALQRCYRQGVRNMGSADVDVLVSHTYTAAVAAAAAAAAASRDPHQ
jgi:hypothetical protein